MILLEVRQAKELGYTLTTVKSEKFKTNLITLNFQSKLDKETVTARSLLPFILRAGCEKYPSKKQLNTYLETMYGASLSVNVDKKGQTHNIKFFISLANEKFLQNEGTLLTQAVELLKEILLHPLLENKAFKQNVVEVEKRLLQEYIESIYDDKVSYSLQKLVEIMCQNEAFATNSIGYTEDLQTLTSQDIYQAYESMLKHDELSVSVVGDIDHEHVQTIFKEHLVLTSQPVMCDIIDHEEKVIESVVIEEEIQNIAQGKLNIGYRTHTRIDDNDYFALLVFNGMFGGYAHSKLFMNVREKASLCYYCGTRLDNYKGLMYVYSGIETKDYDAALKIIGEQLDDMKAGKFTENELELAKKSLINSKLESLDNASGMLAHVSINKLLPEAITVEEWVSKVEAIDEQAIISVSNKIEQDSIFFLKGQEVSE